MEKIVWTSAVDGSRDTPAARARVAQWTRRNPGWDVRVLDLQAADRYTTVFDHLNLETQRIAPADFAQILMAFTLREHGGVWAGPGTFCNAALDDWLPDAMPDGVFAFTDAAGGIAPWFLAGGTDNLVIKHLHAAVLAYWTGRTEADHPDWFARLFDRLRAERAEVAAIWERMPRKAADTALTGAGAMHLPKGTPLDPDFPIFRLPEGATKPAAGSPIADGLDLDAPPPLPPAPAPGIARRFAQIRVSTENLGDHIQIIAGNRVMQRAGLVDPVQLDRDNEIGSAKQLAAEDGKREILMNGWYKNNKKEWPPSDKLLPVFVGFHIRPKICPELVSPRAVEYYKGFEPIGCRDEFTRSTLSALGVECWTSHCPTLTLPRRTFDPDRQTRIYAVSRDGQLGSRLPEHLGEVTDIGHYSGSKNHANNMRDAAALLERYASTAGLIVTSLLHCAMPAIAMGIPVVMFFPPNDAKGRESDKQRFSSLMDLIPIHDERDMEQVDWAGTVPEVSKIRLGILDAIYRKHDAFGPMSRPIPGALAEPELAAAG